jgi:hypothetical protein
MFCRSEKHRKLIVRQAASSGNASSAKIPLSMASPDLASSVSLRSKSDRYEYGNGVAYLFDKTGQAVAEFDVCRAGVKK